MPPHIKSDGAGGAVNQRDLLIGGALGRRRWGAGRAGKGGDDLEHLRLAEAVGQNEKQRQDDFRLLKERRQKYPENRPGNRPGAETDFGTPAVGLRQDKMMIDAEADKDRGANEKNHGPGQRRIA